ncbi:unnamed protein product [Amoebophrya sp. A120]|nr:unnamed protein product [Amoebophrya sp. A120]|eukprot:GSA120T00018399001.1
MAFFLTGTHAEGRTTNMLQHTVGLPKRGDQSAEVDDAASQEWLRHVLRDLWPLIMRYAGRQVSHSVESLVVKRLVEETFRTLPMPFQQQEKRRGHPARQEDGTGAGASNLSTAPSAQDQEDHADLTHWANSVFAHIWPMIESTLQDVIEKQITPEIEKTLPSAIGNWKVAINANLGDRPFSVRSITTLPLRTDPETGRKDLDICLDLSLDQRCRRSVTSELDAPASGLQLPVDHGAKGRGEKGDDVVGPESCWTGPSKCAQQRKQPANIKPLADELEATSSVLEDEMIDLLHIVVGPAKCLVRNFFFHGKLFLTLNDISSERAPLFCAGLSAYFTNPPKIEFDLDFGGVAKLAPGIQSLKPTIVDAIQSAIGKACVLPKRLTYILDSTTSDPVAVAEDANKNADGTDNIGDLLRELKIGDHDEDQSTSSTSHARARAGAGLREKSGKSTATSSFFRKIPCRDHAEVIYPMPKGQLTIRVLEAHNLRGDDWGICTLFTGVKTSDPYVRVAIGSQNYCTPTIPRNCNPSWMPKTTKAKQGNTNGTVDNKKKKPGAKGASSSGPPSNKKDASASNVVNAVLSAPSSTHTTSGSVGTGSTEPSSKMQQVESMERAHRLHPMADVTQVEGFSFLIDSPERQTCEISVWDEDVFSGDDQIAKTSLQVMDLVQNCYRDDLEGATHSFKKNHRKIRQETDTLRVRRYVSQQWYSLLTVDQTKHGDELVFRESARILLRCEWQSVDRASIEREGSFMMRQFPTAFPAPAEDRFLLRVGLDRIQNVYDFSGVRLQIKTVRKEQKNNLRCKNERKQLQEAPASPREKATLNKSASTRAGATTAASNQYDTSVHRVLPPILDPAILAETMHDIQMMKDRGIPTVFICEILGVDLDLVDQRAFGLAQIDEVFCIVLQDPRLETLVIDVFGVDLDHGDDPQEPDEWIGTFQYPLSRLLRERSNVQVIKQEVAPRQELHGSLELVLFEEEKVEDVYIDIEKELGVGGRMQREQQRAFLRGEQPQPPSSDTDFEGEVVHQEVQTRRKGPFMVRKSPTQEFFMEHWQTKPTQGTEPDPEQSPAKSNHQRSDAVEVKAFPPGGRKNEAETSRARVVDTNTPATEQKANAHKKGTDSGRDPGHQHDFLAVLIGTLWPYVIDYAVDQICLVAPQSGPAAHTVLDGLPSPTPFGTHWLNTLLKNLWSVVQTVIEDVIQSQVLPQIRAKLPTAVRNSVTLNLVCDLGQNPPKLRKLYGRSRVEETTIGAAYGGQLKHKKERRHFDLFLDLDGDFSEGSKIGLTIGSIHVGVENLRVRGLFVLALNDLIDEPPFIQGLSAYFVNPPACDFRFAGGLDILHQVNLYPIVESSITDALGQLCVLPKRLAVPLVDVSMAPSSAASGDVGNDACSGAGHDAGNAQHGIKNVETQTATTSTLSPRSQLERALSTDTIAPPAFTNSKKLVVDHNGLSPLVELEASPMMTATQRAADKGLKLPDLLAPMPEGILRVQVLSAENLRGDDWNFPWSLWSGRRTSDPYVQVCVGSKVYRTATINGENERPLWTRTTSNARTDGDEFVFLVEDSSIQTLSLQIFDDDMFSGDDKIAERAISLVELLHLVKKTEAEERKRERDKIEQEIMSKMGREKNNKAGQQDTDLSRILEAAKTRNPFEFSKLLLDQWLRNRGYPGLVRDTHFADETQSVLAVHAHRPQPGPARMFTSAAANAASHQYFWKKAQDVDDFSQGYLESLDEEYELSASLIYPETTSTSIGVKDAKPLVLSSTANHEEECAPSVSELPSETPSLDSEFRLEEERLVVTRFLFGPTSSYSSIGLAQLLKEYRQAVMRLLSTFLGFVLEMFFFSGTGPTGLASDRAVKQQTFALPKKSAEWQRLMPVATTSLAFSDTQRLTQVLQQQQANTTIADEQVMQNESWKRKKSSNSWSSFADGQNNQACSATCELPLTTVCQDEKGNEVPEIDFVGEKMLSLMNKDRDDHAGGRAAGKTSPHRNRAARRGEGNYTLSHRSSSFRYFISRLRRRVSRGARLLVYAALAALVALVGSGYPWTTVVLGFAGALIYLSLFDIGDVVDGFLNALRCRRDPVNKIPTLHDSRVHVRVTFEPLCSSVPPSFSEPTFLRSDKPQKQLHHENLSGNNSNEDDIHLSRPTILLDGEVLEFGNRPEEDVLLEERVKSPRLRVDDAKGRDEDQGLDGLLSSQPEITAVLRVSIGAVKSLCELSRCSGSARVSLRDGTSRFGAFANEIAGGNILDKKGAAIRKERERLHGPKQYITSCISMRSPLLDNDFLNATLTHDAPKEDTEKLLQRETRLKQKIALLYHCAEKISAAGGARGQISDRRRQEKMKKELHDSKMAVNRKPLDVAMVADACNVDEDVVRVYGRQLLLDHHDQGFARKRTQGTTSKDAKKTAAIIGDAVINECFTFLVHGDPKKATAVVELLGENDLVVGRLEFKLMDLFATSTGDEDSTKNSDDALLVKTFVAEPLVVAEQASTTRSSDGACSDVANVADDENRLRTRNQKQTTRNNIMSEAAALRSDILDGNIVPKLSAHFQLSLIVQKNYKNVHHT